MRTCIARCGNPLPLGRGGRQLLHRVDPRPEHARWLSDADRRQLAAYLAADRAGAGTQVPHSLRQVLAEPRTYLFAFIYFSLTTALLMLLFWMPLMIREFGIHDVVQISLLSIVPNAIGAAGLIAIARRSDRKRERRRHFAACALAMLLGVRATPRGAGAAGD